MPKNYQKVIGRFLKQEFPRGAPRNRSVTLLAGGRVSKEERPVVIRKTPIMWGVPCDEVSFSDFWIRFEQHGNKMPWDAFAGSKGTYLPKARNVIHDGFLDSDLDYLMMLDSDIIFPPDMVDRLIARNLPIVGGWYRDKEAQDHHPVIFDFLNEDADGVIHWRHRAGPGKGLEKVDGMGAGCWLVKREVAQALGRSPYHLNSGGEDMLISRKLMKLGIPLYVDWDIACAHMGVALT